MANEQKLVDIVGKENVISDLEALNAFSSDNSYIVGKSPDFIVKPNNLEQVQKLVELANNEEFPLVPCSSTGKHFKGGVVPRSSGCVIVDLSEMKKIIRVNKRNKVAMIEPGVTFGELKEAVEKEGLRIEMPLLPKKTKSVVASLLEREPTTGPKFNWDANDPLCCVEVVFGTGEMFRTGNAAGPGSLEEQWKSGQAQKVPMGPGQTDLGRLVQGAQGTFGIVTWATIKLEQMPKIQKGFSFQEERLIH